MKLDKGINMKVRNLVLGLLLATNVLTAQSAVIVSAGATAAIVATNTAVIAANNNAAAASSEKTMTSTVSSAVISSQNNAIIECAINTERVKKDGDWFGKNVPSLEKTVQDTQCQLNKNTMEQFNNTHYEFGKVKGIFSIEGTEHIMIELIEINE